VRADRARRTESVPIERRRAMAGISTGIGLISGIDFASTIEQLMEIEARPVRQLEGRISDIDAQRTAFAGLSARLLALQNAALRFTKPTFFDRFAVSSTNENVLTAEADASAVPGSYTFNVIRLVTNHSLMSRGYADTDMTPVGAGSISFEVGQGRVNRSTRLDDLNGGEGVRRGIITITDRAGNTAEIDLSTAMTIEEVLEAINNNTQISVRAFVTSLTGPDGTTGDRIVIEDLSVDDGTGLGNLIVADTVDGTTAFDLGIVGVSAEGRIDGHDLVFLADSTPLSILNDGNGVGRRGQFIPTGDLEFDAGSLGSFTVSLSDVLTAETNLEILNSGNGIRLGTIRMTDRSGQSADIDLSEATTVQDILDAINSAGIGVTATTVNSRFLISDTTGTLEEIAQNLVIEDLEGFAAADLGIAGSVDESSVSGRDVYRVATIGDVIRAINFAPDNAGYVEARISDDGNGILLGTSAFTVEPILVSSSDGSTAARDLGLEGASFEGGQDFRSRDLIAGLETVLLSSLNGGQGFELGEVAFTVGNQFTRSIDFSGAETLQDVIDLINADQDGDGQPDTGLIASVNASGNKLELRHAQGVEGPISIGDVTGTLAETLGISGTFQEADLDREGVVLSTNLQLQYISRQTKLEDLNGGRGVASGRFRITDSNGAVFEIHLPNGLATLGEAIDQINDQTPDTLVVRVNHTGDGLLIEDTSDGASSLTIEDIMGSTTASDLGITGTAEDGERFIDGSNEIRIDIAASDTLAEVIRKINDAGGPFSASILNDHSDTKPFSLTISSEVSGTAGELIIDEVGVDFGFTTLARAQNALISVGGSDASEPLLISSSSNTIDDVIGGLTLNLLAADDQDVTVTVAQDIDSIVEAVRTFVEDYNDVQSAIDDHTSFDPDTLERGILLGDSAVNVIRTRLANAVTRQFGSGEFSWLFSVGIRISGDNQLTFDEEKFREAYARAPEHVEKLFTEAETGFGAIVKETLDGITRESDGLIAQRDDLLENQKELLNKRIAALNVLLEAKRARLENQFIGLERALASLQEQQNALIALSSLVPSTSS
jgi:flagellar hook-associated protein 2